ncbi:MAG: tetratricopeptide repeat protein [Anaerolineae bacterium]|nr:tetratricopeptide repeat protein [Anaerolineae bacterium]
MKTNRNLHIALRILLVSLLVACLGLGATSHAASKALANAFQSAKAEDWLGAASYLKSASNYYPWRRELLMTAGRYAFLGGDPKTAINYLEMPGIKDQLGPDDLVLLGEAYQQIGDLAKAVDIWQGLAGQGASPQALQHLVDIGFQQGDYIAALESLLALTRLNPSDAHLQYQVGLLYAATDPLKALSFLATAAEIDPSLAENSRKLHDEIRTASLFDQPAYTLVSSGRQLGGLGEWQLAEQAFMRATEADPDYQDAWAFLGEARQQVDKSEGQNAPDNGLAELTQALKLDSKSVLANSLMGLYWERQQDYAQAQTYLERAAALSPEDPYMYVQLGSLLSKAGDLPAGQANLQKAISLAPENPLFYRLLAEFALDNQIQIRELALPAGRQAMKLDPHSPDSLDLMAKIMLELSDYHAAEQYARQAVEVSPEYAPGYLHLGMAYVFLNQPDLARKWLDRAQKADPDSWVATQATRMLDYYFP